VNILTSVGPVLSTTSSSAPTTTVTNALLPSQLPIAPGIKVDHSQAALSLRTNPEATTPSGGELTHRSPTREGSKMMNSLASPGTRPPVIASVLNIVLGLVVHRQASQQLECYAQAQTHRETWTVRRAPRQQGRPDPRDGRPGTLRDSQLHCPPGRFTDITVPF
jgi:hypothetical protein